MLSQLTLQKFTIKQDQQSDQLCGVQFECTVLTQPLASRIHLLSLCIVLLSYTFLHLFQFGKLSATEEKNQD